MTDLAGLIERMRAARGAEILTARGWLDALGIGGGVVKLGLLLSEGIGTRAGALLEYRLLGKYDSHVKRWHFAVWTDADIAAERARRAAERMAKEVERQAERDRWAAKDAARFGAALTPAPMHTPPVEYLARTRVGSDGQFTQELILGRDGMPMPATPKPEAPKAATPKVEQPAERWHIGCGRPFTAADAIAMHPKQSERWENERMVYTSGNSPGTVSTESYGNQSPLISNPDGTRIASGGSSGTAWDGTLRNL